MIKYEENWNIKFDYFIYGWNWPSGNIKGFRFEAAWCEHEDDEEFNFNGSVSIQMKNDGMNLYINKFYEYDYYNSNLISKSGTFKIINNKISWFYYINS